jgi:hypothetical protein
MDNGTFRKKKGFTITGNSMTRDKALSLKAKGLYLLIMSYITYEEKPLTKKFLMGECEEGKKAFDSAWNELKSKGYLKQYLQPKGKDWKQEYDLLDEPQEGAHTFYLNSKGEITKTNEDREYNRNKKNLRPTQKGSNADGNNTEGNNIKDYNDKGGNNIKLLNNTTNKTINNHSFILEDLEEEGMKEDELIEHELKRYDGIPHEYSKQIKKMTAAIHYLTEWDTYSVNGYDDKLKQKTYNLAVDALIEMACETEIKTYNKNRVTCTDVITKINHCIKEEECKNIHYIIEQAVEDYIKASGKEEIKYPKNYIKSCIFDNFDTYELKFGSLFNRTYYNQNYSAQS